MSDSNSKVLRVSRISHTKAGGRMMRYQVLVIQGDYSGRIGYGIHSALTVKEASEHAFKKAGNNMQKVQHQDGVFPYDLTFKSEGVHFVLKGYRKQGRIVANPKLFSLLELAGYRTGLLKVYGKVNLVRLIPAVISQLVKPTHGTKVQWGVRNELRYRLR